MGQIPRSIERISSLTWIDDFIVFICKNCKLLWYRLTYQKYW